MQRLHVLLVDDDPSVCDVVTAFLELEGHEVTVTDSVPGGLEALTRGPVDLVLSDVDTAQGNGFELLRVARERHPRVGIVLMTAYDEQYSMSKALGAGADGYLSKPFTLNKLSLILERAYWSALERRDWWDAHGGDDAEAGAGGQEASTTNPQGEPPHARPTH